jgi:hypothetical protein
VKKGPRDRKAFQRQVDCKKKNPRPKSIIADYFAVMEDIALVYLYASGNLTS